MVPATPVAATIERCARRGHSRILGATAAPVLSSVSSLLFWRGASRSRAASAASGRADLGRRPPKRWLHSGDPKVGTKLRGTVKDIFESYALLDVGLDTDATLHASRILPEGGAIEEELHIGQEVEVWICGIRPLSYKVKEGVSWKIEARLEVTMLDPTTQLSSDVSEFRQLPPKALLSATVTRIEPYGIIVKVRSPTGGVPVQGFVHVSEIREGCLVVE